MERSDGLRNYVMREYLLFRLGGAMASWGEMAVGEYRPSSLHPTRSAILGLLAAAKGIRRDEEELLQRISLGYGVAVATDAVGVPMRDFHTVQAPAQRYKTNFRSRGDELRADHINTMVSTRDFQSDVLHRVCLWASGSGGLPFALFELATALTYPAFTLYLGRKSCPLSLPLQPQVKVAATIRDAFSTAEFSDDLITGMALDAEVGYYWDDADHSGLTAHRTLARRDRPSGRMRWQFVERREHFCSEWREDRE